LAPIDTRPLAAGFRSIEGAAEALVAERERAASLSDRIRFARHAGKFKVDIEDAIANLDPLAADYETKVREAAEGLAGAAIENAQFQTSEGRQLFEAEITTRVELSVRNAARVRRDALERQALVEFDDLSSELQNTVLGNPGQAEVILAENRARIDALAGSLAPEVRAKAMAALEESVLLATAEGLAMKGQFQAAMDFLRSAQTARIDPDILRNMERRIVELKQRSEVEFMRAAAKDLAELRYKVVTGAAGPEEIAAAEKRGLFINRPEMKWDLLLAFQAEQDRRLAKEAKKLSILGAVAKGSPAAEDPKPERALSSYPISNKDVDLAWEAMAGEGADPEDPAVLLPFVKEVGNIPGKVRNLMRAAAITDDPVQLSRAARLHDAIMAVNPNLDTDANERVELVRTLAEVFNGDYGQASRRVMDAEREMGAKTVSQKNTIVADASRGIDWAAEVASVLDGQNPEAEQVLREAFTSLIRIGATKEGALSAAKSVLIRRGFGKTAVGGVSSVQNFVPENWLPEAAKSLPTSLRVQYVEEEIEGLLKSAGIEPMDTADIRVVTGGSMAPKWRLRMDDAAQRLLKIEGVPQPIVEVLTPYGFYAPVKNSDGVTVRWRPPTDDEFRSSGVYHQIIENVAAGGGAEEIRARTLRGEPPRILPPQLRGRGDVLRIVGGPSGVSSIENEMLALYDELEEDGVLDDELIEIIEAHGRDPDKWPKVREAVNAHLARRR